MRKNQLQTAFLKPYSSLQQTDRYQDAAFTILSYSKHAQDCSWSTPIGAQFFVTFSHHIIYFQLLKHCHTNFSQSVSKIHAAGKTNNSNKKGDRRPLTVCSNIGQPLFPAHLHTAHEIYNHPTKLSNNHQISFSMSLGKIIITPQN